MSAFNAVGSTLEDLLNEQRKSVFFHFRRIDQIFSQSTGHVARHPLPPAPLREPPSKLLLAAMKNRGDSENVERILYVNLRQLVDAACRTYHQKAVCHQSHKTTVLKKSRPVPKRFGTAFTFCAINYWPSTTRTCRSEEAVRDGPRQHQLLR